LDRLEAVGDPALRAAFVYARSQDRPITADELAEGQQVHRNVARSRLERLTVAGLLVPGYERRSGRSGPGAGRPAKIYAVAPEIEALEFPAGRYERLIGVLLETLPGKSRRGRLRAVGVALGEELADTADIPRARSFRVAVQHLCEGLRNLGYQAALAEVGDVRAIVTTATCPLRPLVRSRPEVAELDQAMWQSLARRALGAGSVEQVTCETRDCLEDHFPCRVKIERHRHPQNRAPVT
jgi:predicted ArsR family transcriptional regulator